MILDYDELYKKWVVWLKQGNTYLEMYRGTKKDCMQFMRKKGKKKCFQTLQYKELYLTK